MATIPISSADPVNAMRGVRAGDTLALQPGEHRQPLVIQGAAGTESRPIVIRPASARTGRAVLTSGLSESDARRWANTEADRRQRAGYYPVIGHLGDQAMLVLRHCRYVAIHGLDFDDCWPTAIYLDNCQYVVIHDVRFRGGTFAIGANGIDTHDIVVQHCHWQQDRSGRVMWHSVPWGRIHGAKNNSSAPDVDLENDYRHWDGDFFRAWNIAGNVIIRRNTVQDAFNAVHFFNSFDTLAPGVAADRLAFNGGRQSAANVLIEHNRFLRIRDNIFEPEQHAWNWVIRHNHVEDGYRPFSFEFERAGWFYVYGNTFSFVSPPSQHMSPEDQAIFPKAEWRKSVSVFKPKGVQANEGPIYVANSSFYMESGKGILPKFGLGKLLHVNNAMQFKKPEKARMFGNDGAIETKRPYALDNELKAEISRFTRRWGDYQIEVNGDIGNDIHFPDHYRSLGYRLGLASVQANPRFVDPAGAGGAAPDFTPRAAAARNTAIALRLEFPDGNAHALSGGHHRGAVQPDGFYRGFDRLFRFLPSDSWLPDLPAPRPPNGTDATRRHGVARAKAASRRA